MNKSDNSNTYRAAVLELALQLTEYVFKVTSFVEHGAQHESEQRLIDLLHDLVVVGVVGAGVGEHDLNDERELLLEDSLDEAA